MKIENINEKEKLEILRIIGKIRTNIEIIDMDCTVYKIRIYNMQEIQELSKKLYEIAEKIANQNV